MMNSVILTLALFLSAATRAADAGSMVEFLAALSPSSAPLLDLASTLIRIVNRTRL